MLYLAFIFHMHQPYYKNLLTGEAKMPWVRLHGLKDYLDMVKILKSYPKIRQTFNLVPSLLEQIEDYTHRTNKDKFLDLSYKPAKELTAEERNFVLENFFSINKEKVIALFPRYYELYFKKIKKEEFSIQDLRDLQVYFNLVWIDPLFRQEYPELKNALYKARFFSEEEKIALLDRQIEILEEIIPAYKEFMASGQIEITTSPYYHPILPLLYNIKIAKEANPKTLLPKVEFSYPEDVQAQINLAVDFYQKIFGQRPQGIWPSEESVSEHILPFFISAGINWLVTDEAILFKSLKKKRRDSKILYQPHILKRKSGNLNIIFRDRNLSDLISFVYYNLKPEAAVDDFMRHLKNIADTFGNEDTLLTIAMDGENAWEYYANDGHDFLQLLYQRLSEAKFVSTTTPSEYLKTHPPVLEIKRLAAGSWIFANFNKWMNHPDKTKAWEWLAEARKELDSTQYSIHNTQYEWAWKQIYILEGSDWFWWAGENPFFERLFQIHLKNFYRLINRPAPPYLNAS
ncbi:MAG: glycoside hydrolase family 57 protein [Candidatus Omnitrophica bacterium]|nr:glycoside hydrolase family 57 protein [Candidatus Omnitrophota bacterium]